MMELQRPDPEDSDRPPLGVCEKWKLPNHVRLSAALWTVTRQVPLSTGFSRQEYWIGLPFPSPGDLPDPGIEPRSPVVLSFKSNRKPPKGFSGWLNLIYFFFRQLKCLFPIVLPMLLGQRKQHTRSTTPLSINTLHSRFSCPSPPFAWGLLTRPQEHPPHQLPWQVPRRPHAGDSPLVGIRSKTPWSSRPLDGSRMPRPRPGDWEVVGDTWGKHPS